MNTSVTAVRIHELGEPAVLRLEKISLPDAGPGEVRVRTLAIGLNFADIYQRRGMAYPMTLPNGLGFEAAGTVEAVGPGVSAFMPGERVAIVDGTCCYAEAFVAPADRLVRLPDAIDPQTAVATLGKAMTVEYLLERCYPVQPGQTILFHAAAGGVGLIAGQWAHALRVTVIGTVSSPAKAQLAAENGCAHPIVTSEESFVTSVARITGGTGVPVVYDSVGRDTIEGSLACLSRRGMLVNFGQSSGHPAPIALMALKAAGSVFVTRPSLADYTVTSEELQASADRVFAMLAEEKIRITIGQTFALADIVEAHRAIEERRTVGSTVILP